MIGRWRSQQRWLCLRGHANDPELDRCGTCGLPWWLTRPLVIGVAVVLLVALIWGGYALTQSMKRWQYQGLLQQSCADGQITAEERSQLDELVAYLGLSEGEVARLQRAVAETAPDGCPAIGVAEPDWPPAQPLHAVLDVLRNNLRVGRLREVSEALARLVPAYPSDPDLQRFRTEVEQLIRGRIQVRLVGPALVETQWLAERSVPAFALTGTERGFKLVVEPNEPTFLYAFVETSGGVILPLATSPGAAETPLEPCQSYLFPGPEPHELYPLDHADGPVDRVWVLSSRWPALDLEALASRDPIQSAPVQTALREALQRRHQGCLGGCDLRRLELERGQPSGQPR